MSLRHFTEVTVLSRSLLIFDTNSIDFGAMASFIRFLNSLVQLLQHHIAFVSDVFSNTGDGIFRQFAQRCSAQLSHSITSSKGSPDLYLQITQVHGSSSACDLFAFFNFPGIRFYRLHLGRSESIKILVATRVDL